MNVFIDVETCPSGSPEAFALAREQTKPPGTLKKPESINAWWAEQGEAAVHENWLRQALDPAVGEITAIGFAMEEGEPTVTVRALGEPEGHFLRRAWSALLAQLQADEHYHEARRPFVIGHNTAFDIRFLRARAWANRLRLPPWFPMPDARPGRDYGDTMALFAGYGQRVSLELLCRCLRIANPKACADGRAAVDLWLAGRHDELAAYCAGDVRAVRDAWHILQGGDAEAVA